MDRRIGAEASPMAAAVVGENLDESRSIARWRFDRFTFDPNRSELCGDDGATIALRPKAEALLRAFLAHPRLLLGREALMSAVWPHAVVTDDSLVQCVGELRVALLDRDQRLIRTVPRRGYLFESSVESILGGRSANDSDLAPVLSISPGVAEQAIGAGSGGIRRRAWHSGKLEVALVLAVAVAVAAVLALRAARPPVHIDAAIAARSVIAVMPFAGLEGPDLSVVGDEIADAITNQLATRIGMRGIGRTATSAYGPTPSLVRVAAELKATHVVTGRVRPSPVVGRVTVDAQASDVVTGEVVWSRHFADVQAGDPSAFQEIGQHVVNGMRNRGSRSDDGDADLSKERDAVELTLRGWRDIDRRKSVEDVHRARVRFEAALRQDGESVIALNGLGATYGIERSDPTRRLTTAQIATHQEVVERARRLAPDDSTALLLWGSMLVIQGRPDLALPALEKASRLVPSYPNGHLLIAQSLLLLGRLEEVQARADRAIAMSASDPRRESSGYGIAAEAALMLGRDEQARGLARHAIAAFPDNVYARATLASIEALAGRRDIAAAEVSALLRLWPGATVGHLDDLRHSSHPVYLAQRERFYEGLRLAGLPAGS
jgi:DNA-binding winged helix-turn-helix (wHTH) protein/TolB-like protein/tetratricopeptide (TPR) repeat protein